MQIHEEVFRMLLDGVNHVAIITDDTDRFVRFYEEVLDATVSHRTAVGSGTLTMVWKLPTWPPK